MERIQSGIPGIDQLTGGGIPKNQLVLLTGTSGTGKTIFSSQFIYEGVTKFKENGVYLTFEEPAAYIRENMTEFGWDFRKLEEEKSFTFMKYNPYKIEDVFDVLESVIKEYKASRVVIDSISALGMHMKDSEELRRMIFSLSTSLRKLGCTAVIVSEMIYQQPGISRYHVEEFVCDSVFVMYYDKIHSEFNRAFQVWKLRGSDHSLKLHPYQITKKGIVINPHEEAYLKSDLV